ncbi:hypothetical protein EMCRGX_G005479 [Ephydatia muelleri]
MRIERLPSNSLYPGAPLTTQASWLSIYRFCLANKLTDVATKQLLDLVSIHCPKPNACPKSLYLLKSLFGCMETVNTYYCATCYGEVGDLMKGCLKHKCKTTSAQVCYFTRLSFESRLKSIVEENWNTLHNHVSNPSIPGIITDISDGARAKYLASNVGLNKLATSFKNECFKSDTGSSVIGIGNGFETVHGNIFDDIGTPSINNCTLSNGSEAGVSLEPDPLQHRPGGPAKIPHQTSPHQYQLQHPPHPTLATVSERQHGRSGVRVSHQPHQEATTTTTTTSTLPPTMVSAMWLGGGERGGGPTAAGACHPPEETPSPPPLTTVRLPINAQPFIQGTPWISTRTHPRKRCHHHPHSPQFGYQSTLSHSSRAHPGYRQGSSRPTRRYNPWERGLA